MTRACRSAECRANNRTLARTFTSHLAAMRDYAGADHTTHTLLKSRLCSLPSVLNVCIAGPPASGKGTAAERIVGAFELVHISTGDMLREAMADESNENGQKAAEFMKARAAQDLRASACLKGRG
eukprot:4674300-Pleurochrysis_carterae.AAC.1